jgi:hypothetical protein
MVDTTDAEPAIAAARGLPADEPRYAHEDGTDQREIVPGTGTPGPESADRDRRCGIPLR